MASAACSPTGEYSTAALCIRAWTSSRLCPVGKFTVSEIAKKGIQHADVVSLLDQRGIDYVYIGQRQGTVNSPGPLLDLAQLLSSENYEPVYHQDQVWIFKITPLSSIRRSAHNLPLCLSALYPG